MTDLKRMRDVCPNPSDAVRAMVSGLRTARETKDFRNNLEGYAFLHCSGAEKTGNLQKICYGCAGTCAILESLGLWHRRNEYADYRGRGKKAKLESLTGVVYDDIKRFELDIHDLGEGDPVWLYKYYSVDPSLGGDPSLPLLDRSYSEAELQQYEAFADALKTAGL